MTATKDSVARSLRRSAPLLEDAVLHDAKRVAGVLIERLMGGSNLGYRLTDEEQYLLALAARMYKAIQHDEWTAGYDLGAKRPARPRTPTRNGKRPVQLPLVEDNGR